MKLRLVVERTRRRFLSVPNPPSGELMRGQFARQWWASIATLEQIALERFSALDADNDGVADRDDPAPFDSDGDGHMNLFDPDNRAR